MKLLMHTCCAPCSVYCIDSLRNEGIEPDLYWFNPNIHPYMEYKTRRDTLIEYSKMIDINLIINENYGLKEFCQKVANDLDNRCSNYCYRVRLEETVKFAKENGYDVFTTTLFVSPYQQHEKIKEICEELALKYNIEFLYRDFRVGFREGQNKARELGFYMQKYCGCVFSEEDRYSKQIAKDKENFQNENELVLVIPTKEYESQAINLIEEVDKTDLDPKIRFSGFNSLEEYKDNYEEWLTFIENQLDKEKIPEGFVTANTFFSVRKRDNKVVGIINIRHELNDYLFNFGGHIGYSILPSERRKGYAYKQLLLGLEYCKKLNINRVLITCVDYNIGSRKTIEKAGGILENIVFNPNKEVQERRYWIEN